MLKFWNILGKDNEIDEDFQLNILTSYNDGYLLTEKCKKTIKNFHFKKIKDTILKAINRNQ